MAEPKLEEGDYEDKEQRSDNKETGSKSKGNPLQALLKKRVKILGREIPMPLIILGALGIGIVLFTLIGKKSGNKSEVSGEDTNEFGTSETPQDLGEYAQGSVGTSQDELLSDLGGSVPVDALYGNSFDPASVPYLDISPLSTPELPYSSGFADSLYAPPPLGMDYAAEVPYQQAPIMSSGGDTGSGLPPDLQAQQNLTLSRLATNKVTAIASQSTTKPNVPTKTTSPVTTKVAAKATAKPVSNAQPTRLPTPPPKAIVIAPKPPAKATPKPIVNPIPVNRPIVPPKTLPRPVTPSVPPKTVPKPSTGNKGVKNR